MNFEIAELTEQVAQTTRDFALRHIKPYVMQWDETQEFPVALFKELGALGLMGVLVPEAYGGALHTLFNFLKCAVRYSICFTQLIYRTKTA